MCNKRTFSKQYIVLEVLDFLMSYESYLRKGRISVTSRRRKTSSFVTLVSSLSLVHLYTGCLKIIVFRVRVLVVVC
jgi:hypothetical protein